MNPLHSPAELQYFTNIGHWFEGALLGIIAIVTVIQRFDYLKGSIARYFTPALVFVGGVFLSPYMFLHHGLNNVSIVWDFIINDPAQMQHFIMGNLLLAAGITEILITSKVLTNKLWSIVFPLAVVVIGFLFLIHPQHGTGAEFIRATQIHHILGWLLMIGGIAKGVYSLNNNRYGLLYVWVISLLTSSMLLIVYREPAQTNMNEPINVESTIPMHNGH